MSGRKRSPNRARKGDDEEKVLHQSSRKNGRKRQPRGKIESSSSSPTRKLWEKSGQLKSGEKFGAGSSPSSIFRSSEKARRRGNDASKSSSGVKSITNGSKYPGRHQSRNAKYVTNGGGYQKRGDHSTNSRSLNASPRSAKKRGDRKRGFASGSRLRAKTQRAREISKEERRVQEHKVQAEAEALLKESKEMRQQELDEDTWRSSQVAVMRGQDDLLWKQALENERVEEYIKETQHPESNLSASSKIIDACTAAGSTDFTSSHDAIKPFMKDDSAEDLNAETYCISSIEYDEARESDAIDVIHEAVQEAYGAAAQTWTLHELSAVVPVGIEYDMMAMDDDVKQENRNRTGATGDIGGVSYCYDEANVDLFLVAEKLLQVQQTRAAIAERRILSAEPTLFKGISSSHSDSSKSVDKEDYHRDNGNHEREEKKIEKSKHQWIRSSTASAAAFLSEDLLALLEKHLAADDATLRCLAEKGIKTAEDLQFVDEEDLVAAGCRRVLARKLAQIASLMEFSETSPPPLWATSPVGVNEEPVDNNRQSNEFNNIEVQQDDDDEDEDDRERDFSMLVDEDEIIEDYSNNDGGVPEDFDDHPKNFSAPNPTTADARRLVTVANQLAGAHQYDQALKYYYCALELYDHINEELSHENELNQSEQILDTKKDTAKTLNNLAAVLHQMKRFDEAMDAYSRALETKKISLGENHFSVGHTLYNMACLQLDFNKPAEAAYFMKQTLGIYEEAFGIDHQLTCDVEKQLNLIVESMRIEQQNHLEVENYNLNTVTSGILI